MVDAGLEVVAVADGAAEGLDDLVGEDGDLAAVAADQMVMTPIAEELEVAGAAAEIGLAEQTEIAQELQRAVDGRAVDDRRQRFDPGEDLVRGEMLARGEDPEDQQPLRGNALTGGAQPLRQRGQRRRDDRRSGRRAAC